LVQYLKSKKEEILKLVQDGKKMSVIPAKAGIYLIRIIINRKILDQVRDGKMIKKYL
jgi:hypothetical protein